MGSRHHRRAARRCRDHQSVGWRIELGLTNHIGGGSNPAPRRGARAAVGFGAAYALASLSCTLPVLLALVGQATATANPIQTLAVFAAYAVGATTTLVGVAVTAGLAGATSPAWCAGRPPW